MTGLFIIIVICPFNRACFSRWLPVFCASTRIPRPERVDNQCKAHLLWIRGNWPGQWLERAIAAPPARILGMAGGAETNVLLKLDTGPHGCGPQK
jgi:hypothetical protein